MGEDEHEDESDGDDGDGDDDATSPVGIILRWVTKGGSLQSRLRRAARIFGTADHDCAMSAAVPSASSALSQEIPVSPPGRGAAAEGRGIGMSNASTSHIVRLCGT